MLTFPQFFQEVDFMLNDSRGTAHSVVRKLAALNQGLDHFYRELDIHETTYVQNGIEGKIFINLRNRAVKVVRVLFNQRLLNPISIYELDKYNDSWQTVEGEPTNIILDKSNAGLIRLYPSLPSNENMDRGRIVDIETVVPDINITQDFGLIDINSPFFEINYSTRAKTYIYDSTLNKVVIHNSQGQIVDNNNRQVTDTGTYEPFLELDNDQARCLMHYVTSSVLRDSDSQSNTIKSREHLTLYNNKLDQLRVDKAQNNSDQQFFANPNWVGGEPSIGRVNFAGVSSRFGRIR